MLRRVIAIRNVGRFRSSAYTPNPQWAKNTVVFAPNGFGKTTLCAVLRSLQSNDPALVTGRQTLGTADSPNIDLLFAAGNRRFQNGNWSSAEPGISFFDSTFIADNVHSGDVVDLTNKRKLYRVIIGEAGVGMAQQEQTLAEQARAKQGELTAAERAVIGFVPQGNRLPDFLALVQDPDVAAKIGTQRKLVEALRQAATIRARPNLSPLPMPSSQEHVADLLSRTLDNVADDVEARINEHLEKHAMRDGGQKWILDGLSYQLDDECPFCGRAGIEEITLVQAYKVLFSEAYRNLRTEAQTTYDMLGQSLGVQARARLQTITAQNEAALEFWRQYCTVGEIQFPAIDNVSDAMEQAERLLGQLLTEKIEAPVEERADETILATGLDELRKAVALINETNNQIAKINQIVDEKKRSTETAELREAESSLAGLEALERRYRPEVVAACDEYQRLSQEKAQLEQQKTEVRERLETHTRTAIEPYENRINEYLDLFNAGFRICRTDLGYPGGVATPTYQLSINNVAIELGDERTPSNRPSFKNTLSTGDRTTLALAFFLAGLEGQANLANRVVLFDDPFTSQDAFRRTQTIYEILKVSERCAQVIVFSHDPIFLKQMWEKWDPATRESLQITFHPSVGSKITSFDLNDVGRGRARAELDDLVAFRSAGVGTPREIIKKLRIVIETHFRITYPGSFDPNDNYGTILQKIRTAGATHAAYGDYETLNRINEYTAQYHHGEDPRGAAEPLLDETELTGFVNQTLRLVNMLP